MLELRVRSPFATGPAPGDGGGGGGLHWKVTRFYGRGCTNAKVYTVCVPTDSQMQSSAAIVARERTLVVTSATAVAKHIAVLKALVGEMIAWIHSQRLWARCAQVQQLPTTVSRGSGSAATVLLPSPICRSARADTGGACARSRPRLPRTSANGSATARGWNVLLGGAFVLPMKESHPCGTAAATASLGGTRRQYTKEKANRRSSSTNNTCMIVLFSP